MDDHFKVVIQTTMYLSVSGPEPICSVFLDDCVIQYSLGHLYHVRSNFHASQKYIITDSSM